MDQQRAIVIVPEGTATYTHTLTAPRKNGDGPKTRTMETRSVDVRTLFGTRNERSIHCLPLGCRFHIPLDGKDVFIVEEQPQVRTPHWSTWQELRDAVRGRLENVQLGQETFALALPYVVKCYVFEGSSFVRMYLFFRTAPLTSEHDALLIPSIPNLAENCQVCMPNEYKTCRVDQHGGFAGTVTMFEQAFWGSRFNWDLADHYRRYAHRIAEFKTPWDWERASALDERFVLRVPWNQAFGSVHEFLRARERRAEEDSATSVFPRLLERMRSGAEGDGADHNVAADDGVAAPDAHAGATLVPSVQLGAHTIASGTRIRFTDRTLWPHAPLGLCVADEVHRDASGTVSVQLADQWTHIPISDGDALAPGLAVLEPEPVTPAGYLLADEVTLGDGTVVRKGDTFSCPGTDPSVLTITDFMLLSEANHGFRRARFASRWIRSIESREGTLATDLVSLAVAAVRSVRIGGQSVAVGDRIRYRRGAVLAIAALTPMVEDQKRYVRLDGADVWHLLSTRHRLNRDFTFPKTLTCAEDGARVTLGDEVYDTGQAIFDATARLLRTITAFAATGEGAVDAVLADGTSVPFIRNWARVRGLELVATSAAVGQRTLSAGDRLRLRENMGEHAVGATFTIHHFPMVSGDVPIAVFDCGLGIALDHANAQRFDVAVGKRWKRLIGAKDVEDVEVLGERGKRLGKGVRVACCNGGRVFRGEAIALAKATRGTIVGAYLKWGWEHHWTVEFDRPIPGCFVWKGHGSRGDARYAYLKPASLAAIGPASKPRFTRVFFPQGTRPLVNPGRVISKDRNGTPVRVGDRVRVSNAECLIGAKHKRQLSREKHVFTVVHGVGDRSGYLSFLYLDAGHAVSSDDPRETQRSDWIGYQQLPKALKRDPEFWRHICFAYAENCIVVQDEEQRRTR